MPSETIDVEATATPTGSQQTQTVQRFDGGGAVGRAMTIDELHKNLAFIRDVMRREMKEGQDYGKIPGTGDKPTLLQPGAQKLLMTFNLTESVKKEVLREYPNFHREYEFTVTVASQNGKTWDGVGTCSTLESKYRYRKAERKCPVCGKTTIIMGKKFKETDPEPGWLCWKKKGGCDAKFDVKDPRIAGQDGGAVENEDPADVWNTVRKMAFKRALVAAAINATNTSELWTQDLEEMKQNEETQRERLARNASGREKGVSSATPPAQSSPQSPPRQSAPPAKPPAAPAQPRFATEATRAWMMAKLKDCIPLATEYFHKVTEPSILLPNETLKDLPIEHVPVSNEQMRFLQAAIADFGNGGQAVNAYPANELSQEEQIKRKPKAKAAAPEPKAGAKKPAPHVAAAKAKDPEWWRDVIVPIPFKGMKRDDYMKSPQTVGQLYDGRHDEEMAKRLYGFIEHFEVKTTWEANDGTQRTRSQNQVDADQLFREALDACSEYAEKHHRDTESEVRTGSSEDIEDHDVPF